MTATPRPILSEDFDWVYALNERHKTELSPLSPTELRDLVEQAAYAKVVDPEAGFLVGFDQDASYDSPNFVWLSERFAHFFYVDRIAISSSARGQGLARILYEDFFADARSAGHDTVLCEVNSMPPNPSSDAFHAALGFEVIGEAHQPDRGKIVRYMKRCLT